MTEFWGWFLIVCMVTLARQNCAGCCHRHCITICYDHHPRPPLPCHLICRLTPRCTLLTLVVFYLHSLIWRRVYDFKRWFTGGWCCHKGTTYTFANTCKAAILSFPPLIWNLMVKLLLPGNLQVLLAKFLRISLCLRLVTHNDITEFRTLRKGFIL